MSDEDNTSESEEDIKAHSTDSSMSDDNDGYDEKNKHTTEQLFTVTHSDRQQQKLCFAGPCFLT